MSANFDRHIPDAVLDEFVMEMLSAEKHAVWEEHLLICPRCQERVTEADEYVRVMKGATAEIAELDEKEGEGALARR